jgi:hypothetical protein
MNSCFRGIFGLIVAEISGPMQVSIMLLHYCYYELSRDPDEG